MTACTHENHWIRLIFVETAFIDRILSIFTWILGILCWCFRLKQFVIDSRQHFNCIHVSYFRGAFLVRKFFFLRTPTSDIQFSEELLEPNHHKSIDLSWLTIAFSLISVFRSVFIVVDFEHTILRLFADNGNAEVSKEWNSKKIPFLIRCCGVRGWCVFVIFCLWKNLKEIFVRIVYFFSGPTWGLCVSECVCECVRVTMRNFSGN